MYEKKTIKELSELLLGHKALTFQSQIHLQEELKRRNELQNIDLLNEAIDANILEIKEMKYLKELGFKFEKAENFIKVTRTTQAFMLDILAMVLGIVFCIVGGVNFLSFLASFFGPNEIVLFDLAINLGLSGLGIVGIKFLSGFKRLVDFSGFELVKWGDIITLKKRFDWKLETVEKSNSTLNLEKNHDRFILKLEGYEIFDTNANNIVQRMTIAELANLLGADGE